MVLNSTILNKLVNSDLIKNTYPMIDSIKTEVIWDGDEEWPFYDIKIKIKMKESSMEGFNPHDLVNVDLNRGLKMVGITRNNSTVSQVYIKVVGPDGEVLYGDDFY